MIRGRGLGVTLGGRVVFDGVDVDVPPGRVTAVLGPNGAGKSTLFRVLVGELSPRAGTVTLDGVSLAAHGPAALARRRAAIAQEIFVPFDFTVAELVSLGRAPHEPEATARTEGAVGRALAALALSELSPRALASLSGGERRRAHLARALAQLDGVDGGYLLLDEPLAHLDPAHQHAALAVAREVAARGAGVFVVLHEPNLALAYADHVLVLGAGGTLASGDPRDALAPEVMARAFDVEASWVTLPEDEKRLVIRGPRTRA